MSYVTPPIPPNEAARLEALRAYGVLDTAPESAFDDVARLAAEIFDAPIALVSLVDECRQWFKSRIGIDATETPRDIAFCAHAVVTPEEVLVVPNALDDPRFAENPLVTEDPSIRFYAGAPLVTPEGFGIGTLCVIDREPRQLDERQIHVLRTLARQIVTTLELGRHVVSLGQSLEERERSNRLHAIHFEVTRALASAESLDGAFGQLLELTRGEYGWEVAGLWLEDEAGNALRCAGTWHTSAIDASEFADACRTTAVRAGEGLLGRVWTSGEPVVVADVRQDPDSARSRATGRTELRGVSAFPIRTGDRVVGVVEFLGRNLRLPDEELLAMMSDVGDRVSLLIARARAEAAVVESNLTLRTLIDASPLAIVAFTFEGRITMWNPAAERIFGWSREEALERAPTSIVPDDRRGDLESTLAALVAGQPFVELETLGRRKDGMLINLDVSAAGLRGARGELSGVVCIVADFTARKQNEIALRLAKEAAEAATRAKSEFLANMSHEIRTPMNAVIGMTGLLLDTGLETEQREYAETIRTSGEQLLGLINDILDFSKIESGKLDLERTHFDARRVVEEALDLVAAPAIAKGLDLVSLVDDETPRTVVGDPTRVRQILVNFLSNAVKFTHQGEVFVSVTSRPLDDGRVEIRFAVTDSGIGIPADRMHRLFRSFTQVDASTTREYGGTGLGLAISKRLAEMMGGDVWVVSEVGRGSTFHATVVADTVASEPAGPAESHPLAGKRLLVVDDNAVVRRVLTTEAERWGMAVRVAASAEEALDALRAAGSFDAVALDAQMPDSSGFALASEIERLRGTGLSLVLLGSSGERSRAGAGAGVTAHLTKPVKAEQLRETLASALGVATEKSESRDERPAVDTALAERAPLTILLVEDNSINQKVALRMLKRLGYRADVAASGVEALAALRLRRYDVVFMDVQMPEMDGLEATRRIRAEWLVEQQPWIVAMTANAMSGDRDMCLAAGMDDYVSKPVRIEDLQTAIERTPSLIGHG